MAWHRSPWTLHAACASQSACRSVLPLSWYKALPPRPLLSSTSPSVIPAILALPLTTSTPHHLFISLSPIPTTRRAHYYPRWDRRWHSLPPPKHAEPRDSIPFGRSLSTVFVLSIKPSYTSPFSHAATHITRHADKPVTCICCCVCASISTQCRSKHQG